ncbi:acyl-CoA thioesterase [Leptospira noguchii]|uniref:Thioesterase-like family protein n=1 Tax=Leptospira noguchii serovar Autumnalis str. ZUN142 TaxID=1085540 RepID=M6UFH7_9LEPT|nr:thioesterase family protein [Leptospira noguchii]EKR73021.1 thioesterase-like family protein [Leptospira noguchii str. 2006001870]EMI68197.1 thioesterase-like family protein [Leptospira noguchii str. Bonito]EMO43315.1 thioesterase-like family protein [Leptospira noguchii serovar Autumnalis str. ZUN142]EMS84195.1 thioesterase-like family protein [Leptospira noguchii str. Cascata]EMS88132.1 thioesterase-like family protein [Leptospira noguchii str. Hook]
MTDIQIEFPEKYHFSTELSIRKTDLALDIHVSFASILDLVMEAHLQFFQYLGFSVTDIYGKSIIFANARILYQGELLYKDQVKIDVVLDNLEEKSFDLTFRLSKDQRKEKVALIKIRVLFFDYSVRRVVSVPEGFRKIFTEEKIPVYTSSQIEMIQETGSARSRSIDKLEVLRFAHGLTLKLYRIGNKTEVIKKHTSLLEHIRSVSILLPVRIAGAWGSRILSEKIKNILKAKVHLEELRYLLILLQDLKIDSIESELSDLEMIDKHLKKYLVRVRNGKTRKLD